MSSPDPHPPPPLAGSSSSVLQPLNARKRLAPDLERKQSKRLRPDSTADDVTSPSSSKDKKKRRQKKRKASIVSAQQNQHQRERSSSALSPIRHMPQDDCTTLAALHETDTVDQLDDTTAMQQQVAQTDNTSTPSRQDKGKAKAPSPPPNANLESLETKITTLTKQLDSQAALLEKHQSTFQSFQQSLTCQICLDFLHKPYALAPCGHIACYNCLVTWFTSPPPNGQQTMPGDYRTHVHRKKTCPVCRAIIIERPVEVWTIKSMVTTLVRSGLASNPATEDDLALALPATATTSTSGANGNGASGSNSATITEPQPPNNSRGSRNSNSNDPWHGIFHGAQNANRGGIENMGIFDEEDSMWRCVDCTHEIWDGVCSNCERMYRGHNPDMGFGGVDLDDDEDDEEDEELMPPLPHNFNLIRALHHMLAHGDELMDDPDVLDGEDEDVVIRHTNAGGGRDLETEIFGGSDGESDSEDEVEVHSVRPIPGYWPEDHDEEMDTDEEDSDMDGFIVHTDEEEEDQDFVDDDDDDRPVFDQADRQRGVENVISSPEPEPEEEPTDSQRAAIVRERRLARFGNSTTSVGANQGASTSNATRGGSGAQGSNASQSRRQNRSGRSVATIVLDSDSEGSTADDRPRSSVVNRVRPPRVVFDDEESDSDGGSVHGAFDSYDENAGPEPYPYAEQERRDAVEVLGQEGAEQLERRRSAFREWIEEERARTAEEVREIRNRQQQRTDNRRLPWNEEGDEDRVREVEEAHSLRMVEGARRFGVHREQQHPELRRRQEARSRGLEMSLVEDDGPEFTMPGSSWGGIDASSSLGAGASRVAGPSRRVLLDTDEEDDEPQILSARTTAPRRVVVLDEDGDTDNAEEDYGYSEPTTEPITEVVDEDTNDGDEVLEENEDEEEEENLRPQSRSRRRRRAGAIGGFVSRVR
ncbi:hypothetical protein AX16_003967 [Volvariella volvacea WC 439]|nr:hypothetical protein AX16_003967 [Volvariella volvacea WC 439]